ncbi:hypothetical protein BT69DRAFT_940234 [Atractiella rhizophila]|nr:hypothetical protein BT69DRAFT_940234 [Atractiella rhizophila]
MQFCDGRVKRVLRRFNVVFLAGRPFQKKTVHKFRSADLAHHFKRPPISYDDIPIHYSTVRLIKEGSDGKVKVASRVKRGPVSRHPNGMLFWKRWGLFNGVWEEIPVQTAPVKVKVKQEAPDGLAFSLTDWEEASKVTYQPTLTPKAEILLGGLQAAKRKNNDLPSEMILNTLELRRNLRRNKSVGL